MSDQPDKSEKTEDPTEKRLRDAHEKGDVVKSQEVVTWFMILGSCIVFMGISPFAAQNLSNYLRGILLRLEQFDVSEAGFNRFYYEVIGQVVLMALLPLSLLMIGALIGNLVQHRFVFSRETLKPKLKKISVFSGFKRLASLEALVNFGKSLLKFSVFGTIMMWVVWPERTRLETIIWEQSSDILPEFWAIGGRIFIATLIALTVLAIVDYLYMRNKWYKRQMMSLKEIKDEHKQMEGDPFVRGQLRQLRLNRSRQRMMASVPNASVIITNPTHYAVALKYELGMVAPIVLAKGTDELALRIRAMGSENNVPIVENVVLARALYASADVDTAIPEEHFKAVAAVISYVMGLKRENRWRPV